jgi:membrane peptidoglycan carboxypeptidase
MIIIKDCGFNWYNRASFEKEGGAKDHWFVGYTFQLVGAIWLGYD